MKDMKFTRERPVLGHFSAGFARAERWDEPFDAS